MRESLIRSSTPEEEELDRKHTELACLEARLLQLELEFATLQAELGNFESRYLQIVGVRIAKLDDIEARIAEVLARLYAGDSTIAEQSTRAQAQAKQSARAAKAARAQRETAVEFRPSDGLKSLYREAAKRFHPDLVAEGPDRARCTRIMSEVNAAYKAGDEARLRRILEEWRNSPDRVVGNDTASELIRTIRTIAQVKRRLTVVEAELISFRQSDLCRLRTRVLASAAENRDLMQEMATHLDARIVQRQEQLDKLVELETNSRVGTQTHGQ